MATDKRCFELMTLMVLDSLNAAAFTLSAKFTVLAMNKRAQALLAQGKGFSVDKNRLVAKGVGDTELKALLTRVSQTGAPESMAFSPISEIEVLHVTASRLPSDVDPGGEVSAKVLLLVTQPGYHRVATVRQLMQIFNLSPAEARLARAVAHGQELETFAAEQGVKITTVRTQMAAVHTKARVRRQIDLVRLVLSVPCARDEGADEAVDSN
jgi:DNA-binding CsgD family transcriptional regulator